MRQLPTLEDFPKLLDAPTNPSYKSVALAEQLRTLSRCDFYSYQRQPDYGAALANWRAWWSYYGSRLAQRLETEGRTYPEAWAAIAPLGLTCPSYKLVLPPAWSFRLSFRSGDYGGIVQEELSMNVTGEGASLRRRYQRRSGASWEAERWKDLSVAEAQSFLASLIYAIDNPWIYADDTLADGGKTTPATIPRAVFPPEGSIVGRPKEWSAYYPDVSWTGILDPEGHVLINDDVWSWHTTDWGAYARGERKTMLDYPLGVAFRVIRDRFPDPAWKPEISRWIAE